MASMKATSTLVEAPYLPFPLEDSKNTIYTQVITRLDPCLAQINNWNHRDSSLQISQLSKLVE
jgi:hypothetical protein